jgi:hypothetical protein
MMASQLGESNSLLTVVWFSAPVAGVDPRDGAAIIANRHFLAATKLVQDANETIFMDAAGEILGRWATSLIESVDWPSEGGQHRGEPTGSKAWRIEIQRKHAQAYRRWTEEEEEQLRREFHAGMPPGDMASIHERRVGGITARLERLGLVPGPSPDVHSEQT